MNKQDWDSAIKGVDVWQDDWDCIRMYGILHGKREDCG